MRWLIPFAWLGLLAAAQPSLAQSAPSAPAPVSAQQRALAERMMTAVRFDETMDAIMTMVKTSMAPQRAKLAEIDPTLAPVMDAAMNKAIANFMPRLKEHAVTTWAATFTEGEMKAAIGFYETPEGRSIIEKQPKMAERLMPALAPESQQIALDMMTEACRLDKRLCPGASASQPKERKS
jgi:hypothetical protein